MKETKTPASVDDYIESFPPQIKEKLLKMREVIKKAAPQAVEKISYGMPSFNFKGYLVYYAAHDNHIGLYPFPSAMDSFREELKKYRTSKGTITFPYDKPIPFDLVTEIVKFRLNENIINDEQKKLKKRRKG